jgi:ATP dependent DNA ligase domain
MRTSAFEPCIPTRGTKVPVGPDWLHEIKHDGYRLIVQRDGKRVRLFTRNNGHDWSDRYPLIVEAALRNRASSFVIDSEAVLLGVDGISDFNGLHSRKQDDEVQFLRLRHAGEQRRGHPKATAEHAQGQPLQAAGEACGWDIPFRLRTWRDRARPLPARLPDGPGGPCFETSRSPLSSRPIALLDQGQEPEAPSDVSGYGGVLMTVRLIKHETLPDCGSFEVQYSDGRPSVYFYFDDIAGRRVRPEQMDRKQALRAAQAFARFARDQLKNPPG